MHRGRGVRQEVGEGGEGVATFSVRLNNSQAARCQLIGDHFAHFARLSEFVFFAIWFIRVNLAGIRQSIENLF